jgi:hypothetical protein
MTTSAQEMSNRRHASEATFRFMQRHGFSPDRMTGSDDCYRIENATDDFTGAARRIRITGEGYRLGNIFVSILHATILARAIGCDQIEVFPFDLGPSEATVQVGGITYSFGPFDGPPVATLVGGFFNSFAFESCLQAVQPHFIEQTIQFYIRPLFAQHLNQTPSLDRSLMVLNFRSGDIFDDPPASARYVQPPASFYLSAFEFARMHLGVNKAALVYEDRRNPAVGAVEKYLHADGLAPIDLSGGPADDLRSLLGAAHIAAPFSTFTEAAAFLSPNIRSYFAFRSIEAHAELHEARIEPLLATALRSRGARPFVICDRGSAYIAPMEWRKSDEQLRLIVDYPKAHLDVSELSEPENGALAAVNDEAVRLRSLLRARNDEIDELRRNVSALHWDVSVLQRNVSALEATLLAVERSTSWRLTAPIRALLRLAGKNSPDERSE